MAVTWGLQSAPAIKENESEDSMQSCASKNFQPVNLICTDKHGEKLLLPMTACPYSSIPSARQSQTAPHQSALSFKRFAVPSPSNDRWPKRRAVSGQYCLSGSAKCGKACCSITRRKVSSVQNFQQFCKGVAARLKSLRKASIFASVKFSFILRKCQIKAKRKASLGAGLQVLRF